MCLIQTRAPQRTNSPPGGAPHSLGTCGLYALINVCFQHKYVVCRAHSVTPLMMQCMELWL
jgi:hypothetical protein